MIPIILVGGIPGVGKTSISSYIAREFNINIVLSGDYLREFLRPYTTSEILSKSVYDSWQFFGEKTDENIVRGYTAQSEVIYKGINSVFNRAISNGEPLILETLYFLPAFLNKDIVDKILKIFIYVSDDKKHENMLVSRTEYTHKNSPGERLIKQLPVYNKISDYSIEESKGYDVFLINNVDYEDTKEKIKKYLKSNFENIN